MCTWDKWEAECSIWGVEGRWTYAFSLLWKKKDKPILIFVLL